MSGNRRLRLVRVFVVFAEALLIAWALIFLDAEFGWHLLSEAGGNVLRAAL